VLGNLFAQPLCTSSLVYITQLKQQESKKVMLLVSTLTMWRRAASYHLF